MQDKFFRANIYKVKADHKDKDGQAVPFYVAIQEARQKSALQDREIEVNTKGRRLDASEQDGDLILLNFVTFEYAGPGRVRKGQPTEPMSLDEDESFAPETSMLYHPPCQLALIESTALRISPSAIANYFQEFVEPGTLYQMLPLLDDDAANRARRFQQISRLEISAYTGMITESSRDEGIAPIQVFGAGLGAEEFNLELSVRRARGSSISIDFVRRLINQVSGNNKSDGVSRFRVKGQENEEINPSFVDLIQHRQRRRTTLVIDPKARKVPHQARWSALKGFHQELPCPNAE